MLNSIFFDVRKAAKWQPFFMIFGLRCWLAYGVFFFQGKKRTKKSRGDGGTLLKIQRLPR